MFNLSKQTNATNSNNCLQNTQSNEHQFAPSFLDHDNNDFEMEYEVENEDLNLAPTSSQSPLSDASSQPVAIRPGLSRFQNDVIDSFHSVKSNAAITTTALRSSFIELSSAILKNWVLYDIFPLL